MAVRLLSALTVTAALLAAPALPAHAGALCRQISDASGDARLGSSSNTTGQLSYSSLDILSADVATGKTTLVGALRVKTLNRDQTLVAGATYTLRWVLNGTTQTLKYHTFAASPEVIWFFDGGNGDHAVTGTADERSGVVTWTVPRASNAALKKNGIRLTGLTAETMVAVNDRPPALLGPVREGNEADVASTSRAYADRTATCLKAA